MKVLGSAKDFTIMGSSGFSGFPDLLALPEAEGIWLTFTGLTQTGIIAKGGAGAKLVEAYKTKYGHDPLGSWSIQGAAAFQAILAAIAASDGTRASITDAVFSGKVNIPADQSAIGSEISFDANGDIKDKVVTMTRITSGVEKDIEPWTIH